MDYLCIIHTICDKMIPDKKERKNEIVIFLTNMFFMEIIGKSAVLAIIWLFRFFGMPQLYNLYYSDTRTPKWLFCIILMAVAGISVARIGRQTKNRRERNAEDCGFE
ncbi:MAG: hypothetical protein NC252_02095 [Roseburia sp.]|nr:hypothetical protein [Roseburia sp.]MCM1420064.1 hypothetical protein [Bacteroides sp.]